MIRVKFKSGEQLDLDGEEYIVVGDNLALQVKDIASIELLDMGWGIARGRKPMPTESGGVEVKEIRGLRLLDPVTEIGLDWPLPVEGAMEVAREFDKKNIVLAHSVPEDAPETPDAA